MAFQSSFNGSELTNTLVQKNLHIPVVVNLLLFKKKTNGNSQLNIFSKLP
jgi:hypothetical protein